MSDQFHYTDPVEFTKEDLRWTWRDRLHSIRSKIICAFKGHTPGMIYWSDEGVYDLCGRCSKARQIGGPLVKNQRFVRWSR